MPCRSDDIEPSEYEKEYINICNHLCYLLPILNRSIPPHILKISKMKFVSLGVSPNVNPLDEITKMLCNSCKELSQEQLDELTKCKDEKSHSLIVWWNKHKKLDKKKGR
jgi:hypothetical protein